VALEKKRLLQSPKMPGPTGTLHGIPGHPDYSNPRKVPPVSIIHRPHCFPIWHKEKLIFSWPGLRKSKVIATEETLGQQCLSGI
jgi:hypothetical protein